jgi:hypothetical protein
LAPAQFAAARRRSTAVLGASDAGRAVLHLVSIVGVELVVGRSFAPSHLTLSGTNLTKCGEIQREIPRFDSALQQFTAPWAELRNAALVSERTSGINGRS